MTEHDFEPAHKDVGKHIRSGVINSGFIQIVKLLSQFGTVVILSRLLSPSDFGLMAMVTPVIGFIGLFQNLGLNEAVIQRKELTHDQVNSMFWFNAILGLFLSVIVALLSPLVGWYYGDSRVVLLTVAMAGLVFVGSLGNQHGSLLQRRMNFRALALIDISGTLASLAVSIIYALIFKNYWALYFGVVLGNVIPVIGAWVSSKWRPSLTHRPAGLRSMLKFGAGITSYGLTNFFARNLDNILIGHRWGNEILGLYDRSYKLMLFPLQRMVFPFGGVMTPLLSRLVDEPERYKSAFLKTLGQLTLVTWPGIIWALVFADTILPTLLGTKWIDAVSIFRPMAIVGLIQTVNSSTGWLFISQGRSADMARWGFVNAISCIVAFIVGLPFGATGVATAYAIGEMLCTPFLWWYITRRGPIPAGAVGRAIIPQIVSCLVTGLALVGCRYVLTDLSPVFLIISSAVIAYVTTGLMMLMFPNGRETLKQTLVFAQRIVVQLCSKGSIEEKI